MKKGFSLIETVIIVTVLATVMVTITSLLLNSFRARNRVDMTDTLEQNGSYVISEITKNFLAADAKNVTCAGNQIIMKSIKDGQDTTIICNEGVSIASNSANLTKGVKVTNCGQFVTCDGNAGEVTAINIGFTLTSGVPEAGVEDSGTRSFTAKVAARN